MLRGTKMIKILKEALLQTLLLALGSSICAFAVKGFLVPRGFLSGGLTGASLVIFYVFPGLSLAKIYLLINIPIFLLGAYFVSLRFVLYRGTDRTIIFSVIHRRDIACLKKIVLSRDPEAFIALMTAGDVTGLRIGNQPHW